MVEGKIIGFMSAPGGVGKTILSLLTGWFYHKSGENVLLVDLDPSISLPFYILRDDRLLVDYERKGITLTYVFEKVVEKNEVLI